MSRRSPVTCHILDTQLGKPAQGVQVELYEANGGLDQFRSLAKGSTDADGRCSNLLDQQERLSAGVYKMVFMTGEYFKRIETESFFPVVEIIFELKNPDQHYHIPLLLSAYSYTTYRGS